MQKFTNTLLFGTIIILIIGVIYQKRNTGIAEKQHKNISKREEQKYLKLEYASLLNNYIQLNNPKIWNETNKQLHLKEIVSEPKLIFRISEFNCSSCVDSAIVVLNNYYSKFNDKLIILASYSNVRDLYVFKRINRIESPVYNIKEGEIRLPADKGVSPYFFLLDENLKTNLFHRPLKSNKDRTIRYLNLVMKKMENQ